MSNNFGDEANARPAGNAVGTVGAADDLKALLEQIAAQINNSEQRQTHAFEQMLTRLETLGSEAKSYKSRVPAEFLPAFERIEDGVAQLAERIAATRDAHREQTIFPQPEVVADTAAEPSVGPMVEPTTVVAEEGTWDQQAADALTAHYHPGGAAFAEPSPDPVQDAANQLWGTAPTAIDAIEPQWLDERFAEIARIVEQQVARIGSDPAMSGLGQRFDSFEQRFGSALDEVAKSADLEAFGQLETHISELARQFDDARLQLDRLDGIEQTLAAVVDRLTDPRFDEVLNGHAPSEADLEPMISAAVEQIATRLRDAHETQERDIAVLADAAAERMATRLADFGSLGSDMQSGEISAVRQLLEQFINDRREGDEQTAAMLDTMQQAMIRVLDRVDAIEHSHNRSSTQDYAREQPRYGGDHASASAANMARAVETIDTLSPEPRNQEPRAKASVYEPPRPAPMMDEVEEDDSVPFDPAPREAPAPASASNRPFAAVSGGASIERLRQDFIADAQRAKLKASAMPSAASGDAAKGEKATAKRARAATTDNLGEAVPLSRPRVAASEPQPAKTSRASLLRAPSRKLLVSAIVLLIAVPGIMLLAQKRSAKPAAEPTATTIDSSDKAAALPATPIAPTGDVGSAAPVTVEQQGSMEPTSQTGGPGSDTKAEQSTEPAPPQTNYHSSEAPVVPLPDTRAAASVTDTDGVPAGIAIAHPARHPTLDQIARLHQRQEIAQLSSQLGAAQVGATPAALIPEFMYENAEERAAGVTPSSVASAAPLLAKKALDLPPATVGPLSLRMAAAKGDPSAEFAVAARFADGSGPKQSFSEAADWYQRSASRGFAQSQYRLATLYERGLGVKQDMGRAKIWYARAAEGGNIKAMHNLAVLSAGRSAKTPDYATAAKNFQLAAERGLADSQFNLAVLYEGGLGVPKDLRLAYKWFAIAAGSGDQEAARRRDELERELSVDDLKKVRSELALFRARAADRLANDAIVAGEDWKSRARASGEI